MHSSAHTPPTEQYDHIVVVGVGLIGGSIAKALKARRLARKITGLGRNRTRLLAAQQAGLIDDVAESASELTPFDIAVVCTPVDRIPKDVRALQAIARPASLITDAGSVKGPICKALNRSVAKAAQFVGSHPMAGSEQGGWEHADAQLFQGRTCAITPVDNEESAVRRIEQFWGSLGMRTVRFQPRQHDQIVALTSHMPHAAASAIASLLTPEAWPLAATGFRDTTRVASGDAGLWTSILLENRKAVAERLNELTLVLRQFVEALEANDSAAVEALLARGQHARDQWTQSSSTGPSS
ncbi:MAG: prephenate dehydrogenase/arogenate dehydrogenase family protein [Planctomycetaceae bacterium]